MRIETLYVRGMGNLLSGKIEDSYPCGQGIVQAGAVEPGLADPAAVELRCRGIFSGCFDRAARALVEPDPVECIGLGDCGLEYEHEVMDAGRRRGDKRYRVNGFPFCK